MRYLANALSLGMLDMPEIRMEIRQLTLDESRIWLTLGEWESCVGHLDTALLLTPLLGIAVEMRRVSTSLLAGESLLAGDELLAAQYNGPRLNEGAVSLPEGAKIRWYLVRVEMGSR